MSNVIVFFVLDISSKQYCSADKDGTNVVVTNQLYLRMH